MSYQINENSLELIKKFEGYRDRAYLDSVGIPTIGFGTIRVNGQPVKMGMTCTLEEACDWLLDHCRTIVQPALDKAGVDLTESQGEALTSFIYNVGAAAFLNSTLLKKLKAGDIKGAADQFLVWDMAGGKHLVGLQNRRVAEREWFLK